MNLESFISMENIDISQVSFEELYERCQPTIIIDPEYLKEIERSRNDQILCWNRF